MNGFSRLLCFIGVLGFGGAFGVANAATVPAPIYDQNTTMFGTDSRNIKIATSTAGDYRFTVSNIGDPSSTLFPPFEMLAFNVTEKGVLFPIFDPDVPVTTKQSVVLGLTAFQTYFVNVIGMANPGAFLEAGTFNLEVVQVIPIPAAAVLFSSAILGLVVVARRRGKTTEVATA
jgi:hypothetical protein